MSKKKENFLNKFTKINQNKTVGTSSVHEIYLFTEKIFFAQNCKENTYM